MGLAEEVGMKSALRSYLIWIAFCQFALIPVAAHPSSSNGIDLTVSPKTAGDQLLRFALPCPRGWLHDGETIQASCTQTGYGVPDLACVRPLTWYPARGTESRCVRRAMVTFIHTFAAVGPIKFHLTTLKQKAEKSPSLPTTFEVTRSGVTMHCGDGTTVDARLISPLSPAGAMSEPTIETVESNAYFLWQRFHFHDDYYPVIIEVRSDAMGSVTVVAHLQRTMMGDGRMPNFGWVMSIRGPAIIDAELDEGGKLRAITQEPCEHLFKTEQPCTLLINHGDWRVSHPAAPFKKRGAVEAVRSDNGVNYRYMASLEGDRAPMQQASWRRAEFVLSSSGNDPPTAALQSPHHYSVDWKLWNALYNTGKPLNLKCQPQLDAMIKYNRSVIVASSAHGDDWGNLTGYNEGQPSGSVFGMNRLNHCWPIFNEGYLSGDDRLIETALEWCDNFYDQSIWWGPGETGGTRYNNVIALGKPSTENDTTYMWRSNNAVSFCTKGYDAFWYAWEQTGDPRMKEALDAQLAYSGKHLNAGANYTRNIGDVRDLLSLYRFSGDSKYMVEAVGLFHDLKSQLSTGHLFTESGKPIEEDPPFIEEDKAGYAHPFAKPYILGYALAGLPELAKLRPHEPELREVIQAVTDFMDASQDPIGAWRYPHPRSTYLIVQQGIEHAWQIRQADILLGPRTADIDAIERTLRQRIFGWLRTGSIFAGLTGWETVTKTVKSSAEISALYKHPEDRDSSRDYTEGQASFGSASPEGIVYLSDLLGYYLKHRTASCLMSPPPANDPLWKVLARTPTNRNERGSEATIGPIRAHEELKRYSK